MKVLAARNSTRTIGGIIALLLTTATLAAQSSPGQPSPQQPPVTPRERWNKEYDSGTPALRNPAPSAWLASFIKGRKPGAALDVGIGQGRNAVFLAEQGWSVTGVDISDSAIALARQNAAARKVSLQAVVADLDEFDFGEQRWDLITSFYMHSWHKNSKTNVPDRILRSLKPGGVVVMEAFRRPPNVNGFVTAELSEQFRLFKILLNEETLSPADWALDMPNEPDVVRFIAERPRP